MNRIREEGLKRSQVMETVSYLADVIGPRLSGSPQSKLSQEWTRDRLAEWGMSNAHLEGFEFGEGWSFSRVSVHMVSPHKTPLIALPKAWTPGTKKSGEGQGQTPEPGVGGGSREAQRQAERHHPISRRRSGSQLGRENEPFKRLDEHELEDKMGFNLPSDRRGAFRKRMMKRFEFRETLKKFLKDEGVIATVDSSSRGNGCGADRCRW